MNRSVKILGGRFYPPSLRDEARLEDAHFIFLIFPVVLVFIFVDFDKSNDLIAKLFLRRSKFFAK